MIITCPNCGKLLFESEQPEIRMRSFWCDDCRLDITIVKKRKCTLKNIVWDTGGEDVDDLPTEVIVPHEIAEGDKDTIVDNISDAFGWCIKSCDVVREE